YLSGDHALMEDLAATVVAHATTLVDQVSVYETRIQCLISQERYTEAIDLALPLLERLGAPMSRRPSIVQLLRAMLALRWRMRQSQHAAIAALPAMTDAGALAVLRITTALAAPIFRTNPKLVPSMIAHQVRFSLRYGNGPFSAAAY